MASTKLFAPQVQAVQPAFTGDICKVYFRPSEYNSLDQIKYVMFSIVDPNINSTWGTNSILSKELFPTGYGLISKESLTKSNSDYYFSLDLSSNWLKGFNNNQYYQVQLYFIDNAAPNTTTLTNAYLSTNKEYISAPSQATLIRKISNATLTIDGQKANGSLNKEYLNKLTGFITYDDGTEKEFIQSVQVEIFKDGYSIYKTPVSNNTLGIKFEIDLPKCYLEEGSYKIKIKYTTINGYVSAEERDLVISQKSATLALYKFDIRNSEMDGATYISFSIPPKDKGMFSIQRSRFENNFRDWETIYNFIHDGGSDDIDCTWADFYAEAGIVYKYRIRYVPQSGEDKVSAAIDGVCTFEDIFLADIDRQLSVRLNPQVTGFKYVTQDNITNTLGGKFPIVRRSGQIKYRQFQLSGLLSFETDVQNLNDNTGTDSRNMDLEKFFPAEGNTLFFNPKEALQFAEEWYNTNSSIRKLVLEKKYRDTAIDFLSNGKPKLFRSLTEGNIIVYLSNVNFTPNQQLGRNVWTFSATATEIDEFTIANLEKYNIKESLNNVETFYMLDVISVANGVAYVSADRIEKRGNDYYLILNEGEWKYE